MDISKILDQLRSEMPKLDKAIASLAELLQGKRRWRMPPPAIKPSSSKKRRNPTPASAAAIVGNVPYGRKRISRNVPEVF
jgi:hypothetical protein